jgi:thiol-disulfide isomerase/thioredoxin
MDRLPLVVAAAVALCACGDDNAGSSSRERVNAVQVDPKQRVDPAAMCDVFHAPGAGPTFAWPELTTAPPTAKPGRWQWINVWATWCKPCIEELPRLTAWRKQLGDRVALYFVSADADDEVVTKYRADHPATPASGRLAAPDAVTEWIASLGVAGATLPVHIFVDPSGAVRCVRASAVEDTDFPAVDALLR